MDPGLNISIIAAVAENGVIGQDGDIPWVLGNDLRRFAELTKGHRVIVGRKTHESILKRLGQPLKDRQTIIITRQQGYSAPDECDVVASWEEALEKTRHGKEVFVIGGAEIYHLAIPYAKRLYLTRVHVKCNGNAFFPTYDIAEWKEISSKSHSRDKENEYNCTFTVMERKPESFVNLKNARVEDQYRIMEAAQQKGVCPFCPDQFSESDLRPIIKQGDYWHIRENRWPYKNTRAHFLIIHNIHVEKLSEISPEAAKELFSLTKWIEEEYEILGGGLCLRFGDISVNGGTVLHLHFHIITAEITDKEDPEYQKVRFKVG